MENEMPILPDTRQVLLAAAPNDPQANALIAALQVSTLNVIVADTIELAARVDEFALCIIILRPGQWRTTPVISTAMRCSPRAMIPVLTEPMALPAGAWSTEAVSMKEPLSETVHELEVLVNELLAKGVSKDRRLQTRNGFRPQEAPPRFRPINYRRHMRTLRIYAPIGLIIVLLIGLLVFTSSGKHTPSGLGGITVQSSGSPVALSAFQQSDTVSVPGPGCNTNNSDWWDVGTQYKTVVTPTVTSGNTSSSPTVTPTAQVVQDNSTVATCQQHGLYVQHNDHYDSYAEIFFHDSTQTALPQHFKTQITATALNPSKDATFVLGVRHQYDGVNGDNTGYGDDGIEVGVDGTWITSRTNDATDQVDTLFGLGYVKVTKTIIVGAEVNGSRITFSINGKVVTTFVDKTFPHGYAIDFGLCDDSAKSAPSALYSDFVFTPLA